MGDVIVCLDMRYLTSGSWSFKVDFSISRGKSLVLHHTSLPCGEKQTSVLPTSTLYSARQATNLT